MFATRQPCAPPAILDELVELLFKALDSAPAEGANEDTNEDTTTPATSATTDTESPSERLVSMGFSVQQADFALAACNGDADAAMNLLLNQ